MFRHTHPGLRNTQFAAAIRAYVDRRGVTLQMCPTHPAQDLDLKLVRCFTVVAEHRHFGRAATALHLTASSLSRQISRLEQLVGARLLTNSAGAAAAPNRPSAARRRVARPAGHGTGPGRRPAGPDHHRLHREHHRRSGGAPSCAGGTPTPRCAPSTCPGTNHGPRCSITGWTWRWPGCRFHRRELHVTVLYDEPRALLVPLDHGLVSESVTLDDIAHEPLSRTLDPIWNAFWRVDPRPDGRPAPDGPLIEGTVEDKIELIAGGQAVAIVRPAPASTACVPTSPRSRWTVSNAATSCWPPARQARHPRDRLPPIRRNPPHGSRPRES